MISDSLLASASVVPASSAARVGKQADRAGHAVEHDVAVDPRHLARGIGSGEESRYAVVAVLVAVLLRLGIERELYVLGGAGLGHRDERDVELDRLLREQRRVAATGRESHDLEAFGVGGDQLEGLRADRARRTENGDTLSHVAILAYGRAFGLFARTRRWRHPRRCRHLLSCPGTE